MDIFHTKKELAQWVEQTKDKGLDIGLVPTMGALHQGHLALVSRAFEDNTAVVCSIFVNPIQFNNAHDLEKYPRNLERDLEMLASINCHAVFCPSEEEMYPQPPAEVYDFGPLQQVMEGKYRPGHFNGVAIVVKRLFEMVSPHRAYFGQKDYQQLQIIRQLVKQEKLPVQIICCPIVRETDGLAMSSRNVRLSPDQRQQAPTIYQTLCMAREKYPLLSVGEIKKWVEYEINKSPLMQLEYFEIVAAHTLLPISHPSEEQRIIACIAVQVGQVRLIDNLFFN